MGKGQGNRKWMTLNNKYNIIINCLTMIMIRRRTMVNMFGMQGGNLTTKKHREDPRLGNTYFDGGDYISQKPFHH